MKITKNLTEKFEIQFARGTHLTFEVLGLVLLPRKIGVPDDGIVDDALNAN